MKTLKTILQEVISGIKAWVDANVVHKSGNETIGGTKTFSDPQCYSSNAILFNSSVLPTQNTAPSGTINPLRQYIGYGTSYANSVFIHDTEMRANGRNHYRWTIYSDDHSANTAMWLVYNPDSDYIRYLDVKGSVVPDADNTYHLGMPTGKWATLNGINPGALSLPDIYDSYDVVTTNWSTAYNRPNDLKINGADPSYPGWLFIRLDNCTAADDFVIVRYFHVNATNLTFFGSFIPTASSYVLSVPIQAGITTKVWVSKIPTTCKYYACLGTVK